jgi:hypothetical protein
MIVTESFLRKRISEYAHAELTAHLAIINREAKEERLLAATLGEIKKVDMREASIGVQMSWALIIGRPLCGTAEAIAEMHDLFGADLKWTHVQQYLFSINSGRGTAQSRKFNSNN